MNINQLYQDLQTFIFEFGPKHLGAIVVWIVGSWIIKFAVKTLSKVFERTKLDKSLKPFLLSLTGMTFRILLAISFLGMLGVEMTSFIAILTGCSWIGHWYGTKRYFAEFCRGSNAFGL